MSPIRVQRISTFHLVVAALVGFTAWVPLQTTAAVLSSHSILKRAAKSGGRTAYSVRFDVEIQAPERSPLILKEHWVFDAGGKFIKLEVQGKSGTPAQFEVVYKPGTALRQIRMRGLGPGEIEKNPRAVRFEVLNGNAFFEPVFFYRDSSDWFSALERASILPPGHSKNRQRMTYLPGGKIAPTPLDSVVFVSRMHGVLSWALAKENPALGQAGLSAAWFEQDAFLMQRLLIQPEVDARFDDFAAVSGGLKFPKSRTYKYTSEDRALAAPVEVRLQTTSIQSISSAAANKAMSFSKEAPIVPSEPLVREFYSRFR